MSDFNLVSVVIPVYNLEYFLSATLDSVLSQTYSNFEVLVVDDASTDGSKAVISAYQQRDSRVKLLANTHKKGASGTRNTAIDAAQGEWLAFLDGDDIWHPDALQSRLQVLAQYPDADFISSDYAVFYNDIAQPEPSRASSNSVWQEYFGQALNSGEPVYLPKPLAAFLRTVLVHTDTVLVKTNLIKALKGFDESLPAAEDVLLWVRLSAISHFVFVPKTLAFYRQRPGSLTNSAKSLFHYAPVAYKKLLSDPAFSHYKAEITYNIQNFINQNSFFYRKQKNYWQALLSSFEGVIWQPTAFLAWKNLFASLLLR